MSLNPVQSTAQNTYSGSYSIQSHYKLEGEPGSIISGIAKYNYIEKNDQRIFHGPFKFSTTQPSKDFLPTLIDLETDSVTIIGSFNNGKKNGLWTIKGYHFPYHEEDIGKISIEIRFNNGVIDGPVKGYSSLKSKEICSFDYSFTNGKLNGPFQMNFFNTKQYDHSKINCLLNFNNGLFDGNNTISFFDRNNIEFKLLRQYDNGLLNIDKYQDLSTGEYIVNEEYDIDFSPPDYNHTMDFANKLRAVGIYEYVVVDGGYVKSPIFKTNLLNEYFTLLNDISKGKVHEIASFGYFLTSNSEIVNYGQTDTIQRLFADVKYLNYISDKDEFLKETLPNELWHNIYMADPDLRNNFVDKGLNYGYANSITLVNEHIFDLLNLIFIFPLGQDTIEIKPIKEPYIFVSQEAEELYASYRIKFLSIDSINRFKQDSLRFLNKISDDFGSFKSDQEILSSQFSFYYFRWEDEDFQKLNNALLRQFQNIKRTEQELSGQSNLKFVSEDLRVKQDSILDHYKEFQIRFELLNKILLATVDLEKEIFDQFFLIPKFQSQLKKFFEIPGANDRYNDNRQFIFRPDKSSEEELNHILQIINERKEIYSKIVKDNIRVTPTKYTNIDEFLKDLKTM